MGLVVAKISELNVENEDEEAGIKQLDFINSQNLSDSKRLPCRRNLQADDTIYKVYLVRKGIEDGYRRLEEDRCRCKQHDCGGRWVKLTENTNRDRLKQDRQALTENAQRWKNQHLCLEIKVATMTMRENIDNRPWVTNEPPNMQAGSLTQHEAPMLPPTLDRTQSNMQQMPVGPLDLSNQQLQQAAPFNSTQLNTQAMHQMQQSSQMPTGSNPQISSQRVSIQMPQPASNSMAANMQPANDQQFQPSETLNPMAANIQPMYPMQAANHQLLSPFAQFNPMPVNMQPTGMMQAASNQQLQPVGPLVPMAGNLQPMQPILQPMQSATYQLFPPSNMPQMHWLPSWVNPFQLAWNPAMGHVY